MVLRVPYRLNNKIQVGVVDLLEGGIPLSGEHLVDVYDIEKGAIPNFSILSLHPKQNDKSAYYGKFLNDSAIGYIFSYDVRKYMDFMETIYFPLGNDKLERYFFECLAISLGFYPKTYVNSIDETFGGLMCQRAIYITVLWIMRVIFTLIPVFLLLEILSLVRIQNKKLDNL